MRMTRYARSVPFLPRSSREWWTVALVFPCAALLGGAIWLADQHLSKASLAILFAVALLAETAFHAARGNAGQSSANDHQDYGRIARVTQRCATRGRVTLDGVFWVAVSLDGQPLEPGEQVYVHGGRGLELHVSRRPTA
jgi:membrane protein implicated in regulation of membrane protease activity